MSDTVDRQTLTARLLARAAPSRARYEDLVVVPLFAVVVALVLGGVAMLATNVDLATIGRSYVALAYGSFGSLGALSETLTAAIPLVFAGLGLALGFRAGLFNIGAEGQILMGGMAAVVVGFSFTGLPFAVHLPLALLAGVAAGAAYAGIAGWIRAATGAHEVILTIMLNMISYRLVDYLLRLPSCRAPNCRGCSLSSTPICASMPASSSCWRRSLPSTSCSSAPGSASSSAPAARTPTPRASPA
jgi:simple sugar transport system permease protein